MSSQLMEMSTDCFFIFDIFFIVVYVCIFLKNFVMESCLGKTENKGKISDENYRKEDCIKSVFR